MNIVILLIGFFFELKTECEVTAGATATSNADWYTTTTTTT